MDKHVGKVVLVRLPNSKRPTYKWIVRKRDDGRFVVRSPKNGVLLKNLKLKRDDDYGKETLLPVGTISPKYGVGSKKKFKNLANKTRKSD
jgi:hypothetical protein